MILPLPIRCCLGLLLAATAFGGSPACAEDPMMRVFMNQARILKLDRPVSKVIIGNEKVADATVADPKTIVLTGRSFGTTNLVLLDSQGNAIVDERILVSIDEANTVRLYKQTQRTVLSCTPSCEQHTQSGSSSGDTSSTGGTSSATVNQ
ncbi:Flp pilus assembly secretin CpaC [Rhizobium taibaishanense]|uniref:Flp pilus assembly secretin CpaC n=1 Tax=Allorhizobium taibaishanense TaxID=887144 RepID=A0A7W6HQN3_9HYPH|nr:pilus assembly protein N-terminal domain-containing protein [Allorhizobium taibaishanense]MBB4009654.1 Flp pilus assembly secretin CpaC [Allorhizobium taibaishanense]